MSSPVVKIFRSRLNIAIILLTFVFVIGVFGFKIISDFSWIDAAYMTVITITTVGFGEVQPLDQESKIFTIFLILTSVIIVGYAIKVITEYIISRDTINELKQKKIQKKIDALSGHVIICGFGRNGKQAAKKLATHNRTFVVVEKDELVTQKYLNDIKLFVNGNANEDEVLIAAGIQRASCLISALPNDSENLFVVLSARQMNSEIRIISRASQETSYSKLKLAGANNVILPDRIGGDHMASLVVTPDVIEFVGRLTVEGETTANLEEISVNDLPKEYLDKTILDLDLRRKTGCTVIGFKAPDNSYLINPEASIVLQKDSHLIVLGRPEQISKLRALF